MIELKGNDIKDAILKKLWDAFPNTERYDESITTPVFPNFFVFQLTFDAQTDNYNYWFLRGLYNIRYRVAADTTRVSNLNEQLDNMAFQLSDIFSEPIPFMDGWLKLTQTQTIEKVDGVLHAFFSANVRVTKPLPVVPLQETLDSDIQIGSVENG